VKQGEIGIPNLVTYLYHCTADGAIQNYVGCAITGNSLADYRHDPTADIETGVAHFNMLRPGYYKVSTYVYTLSGFDARGYGLLAKETPIFELSANTDKDIEQVITFGDDDDGVLVIQTTDTSIIAASANSSQGTDAQTRLSIFTDEISPAILSNYTNAYAGYKSMLVVAKPPAGQYWLWINDNRGYTPNEYGLWLSHSKMAVNPSPGTFTNPVGGTAGLQRNTRVNAMPIELDELYYGRFGTAAQGGTSATTGHYYTFTIE
jgi:hypothetical protein